MHIIFLRTLGCLAMLVAFTGCGVEGAIKRNDDRYLKPGAMDMPLTGYNDIYRIKFLGKYRVTHQWPVTSDCEYRKVPTLNRQDRYKGEVYAVRDIVEYGGKTWQRFENSTPYDFDRFVRSVKVMHPVYGNVNGIRQEIGVKEYEEGMRPVCFEGWYTTSHILRMRLLKRDIAAWRIILAERAPAGRWSQQKVAENLWQVNVTAEQDLKPRPLNGSGGPFQTWVLPIGDTGYTIAMELGASQESLQYPEAHEKFKAAFRGLIESVKIDPLQP